MMSPTGSPITSPPSEPSSYDEPRGDAHVDLASRPLAWLPIRDLDRIARADVAVGGHGPFWLLGVGKASTTSYTPNLPAAPRRAPRASSRSRRSRDRPAAPSGTT